MDAGPQDTTVEHRNDPVSNSDRHRARFAGAAAHGATWGVAFLTLRIFADSGYDWQTARFSHC